MNFYWISVPDCAREELLFPCHSVQRSEVSLLETDTQAFWSPRVLLQDAIGSGKITHLLVLLSENFAFVRPALAVLVVCWLAVGSVSMASTNNRRHGEVTTQGQTLP